MRTIATLIASLLVVACAQTAKTPLIEGSADAFVWSPEQFADIKIIRYQVPGFERLSLQQKKLVYYLVQAGLAGRDIMWDQNYRHNLSIRKAIEAVLTHAAVERDPEQWPAFELYARRVFFANGIHHHYSNDKFEPGFSRDWFEEQLSRTDVSLESEALRAIFDADYDNKKINLDPARDLILASAVNFYGEGVSEADVDNFYAAKTDKDPARPVSHGLNSQLVKSADGTLSERVWRVGGMYGEALEQVVAWLEKAVAVAENKAQADALRLLIDYYRTGDLATWDDYNIAWVSATEGDVDYIQGFVEVYNDPKGYRGSFENIVQIKDFEASERMQRVAEQAQWFEDNSPILQAHKKSNVVGISYNVVSVAGESGDASPSTPVGVNLPNANWIRAEHGSKSVSLGSIVTAYDESRDPGLLLEFAHDEEEIARSKAYGTLAGKLRTALHEVVGHASGQLEPGVGTPKETLKNYRSALEEARADLVAMYYIADPKLIELGLFDSDDVAKAAYDSYLRNGLMMQLRRIEPGKNIEQAHMRNRQMVASWIMEKAQADNVVSRVERDGKTYIEINDYTALRELFGELLREVQRIKSQGDYEAGRALIEDYGVQVDPDLHAQVLARSESLKIPPYGGFINPELVPVRNGNGEIIDIEVQYPEDFVEQMLSYGERYAYLPVTN